MPVFLFWLPGPKGQYIPAMDRATGSGAVARKNFALLQHSSAPKAGGSGVFGPRKSARGDFSLFFSLRCPCAPGNPLSAGIRFWPPARAAPRRTWAGLRAGSPFSDLQNLAPFGALLGPRGRRTPAYDLAGTRKVALLGRRGRSAAGTAERGTAALPFFCDIQRSSRSGRSAPRGRGSARVDASAYSAGKGTMSTGERGGPGAVQRALGELGPDVTEQDLRRCGSRPLQFGASERLCSVCAAACRGGRRVAPVRGVACSAHRGLRRHVAAGRPRLQAASGPRQFVVGIE